MTNKQSQIPTRFRRFSRRTNVNVNQSDIRAVVRGELNILKRAIRTALTKTPNRMTRYHILDALKRVDAILDPK